MKAAKREEEKRGRRRGHIIQRTRHTRHKEIKNSSRKVEKKLSAEEEKKRREGGVKRWAVLGKYKKRQTHAERSGARSHLTGLSCSPPTSLSPSLFHSAVLCSPLPRPQPWTGPHADVTGDSAQGSYRTHRHTLASHTEDCTRITHPTPPHAPQSHSLHPPSPQL